MAAKAVEATVAAMAVAAMAEGMAAEVRTNRLIKGRWRGVGEREFRTPACGRSNHEIHRPSKVSPGEITRVISG